MPINIVPKTGPDKDKPVDAKGKPVKKAKGGMVSASKRADGIAKKGKTRGKIC